MYCVCPVDPCLMECLGWFDEAEGKQGPTMGVMTVFVTMFHCTAPSEVYSIICALKVFCIINYYFPCYSQAI